MIKKLLLAIIVGLVATVYFVQNDTWAHDEFAKRFKPFFQNSYDCAIDFKVKAINVFDLSVTLEQVKVGPKSENDIQAPWDWQAGSMKLGLSWFSLLGGLLGLEIYLEDVQASSNIIDGHIAILEQHIRKYIDGPALDIPVYLKVLAFKDSSLKVEGSDPQLACMIHFDCDSRKVDDVFKAHILLRDTSFGILKRAILSHCAGTVDLKIGFRPTGYMVSCVSDCALELDYLPEGKRSCTLHGTWLHDKGEFAIKNADQSLHIEQIALHMVDSHLNVEAKAQVPFSYVVRIANPQLREMPLAGTCAITLNTAFAPDLQEVHGNGIIGPISYRNIKLFDQARVSFNRNKEDKKWHGFATIERPPLLTLQGEWQWDEDPAKGHLEFLNSESKGVPGLSLWRVAEKNLGIQIDVDEASVVSGSYTCLAESEKQETSTKISGNFLIKDDLFTVDGVANNAEYQAQMILAPEWRLKKLVYLDEQKDPLIALDAHPSNVDTIQGSLNFSLFKVLVHNALNYDLQGQGKLLVDGTMHDQGMNVKARLEDGGTIRLPETYNFLSNFDANIDLNLADKKIIINSLSSKLLRGTMQLERAVALFDHEYKLAYAYLPLTFDSCLLNLKKDLFAMFSGAISFTKKNNELPLLKGHVIIDRSQLNENILSDKFQKSLFAHTGSMFDATNNDMKCDITVETKNPVRVETALLQATAKVGMHIKNTLQDPYVSGVIEILSGALQFPYRPLNIAKGSIYFMPQQLYDPIIELTAKNKIKKYTVSLQVSGSLQNHHIALESTPPLSEEQILSLLLVGSQEESLNVMMPALIAQNLKTLIFDTDQSPLKLDSYFKSWLKPFKNIHLVPSFTDQTGRGGLRGAIEIDINDRTRALIQKNFNLTEDTRFEVEYLLSDDVSVRGIRDERKDVGGEIEMRWKFGG